MINGLLWLIGCQLVGEFIAHEADAPVPGPVIGMVLLWAVLTLTKPGADASVMRAADGLLKHLQLLFIPSAVGIVTLFGLVADHLVPLAVGVVTSWLAGLLTVGWLVTLLTRRNARGAAR